MRHRIILDRLGSESTAPVLRDFILHFSEGNLN